MKPILFVRVADMKYYKGITEKDSPSNGGSYVKDTGMAHECYNFDEVEGLMEENCCLGFTQLMGGSAGKEPELHIEKIVGCELMKKEAQVEDVTVVFCSKANGSQSMRVVGFYKHATIYRKYQVAEFESGYEQSYLFVAKAKECVVLPYRERHSNGQWYVPTSGKNKYSFGFGRANVWYAGANTKDVKEVAYVEKMLMSIENYAGENWMQKGEF